MNNVGCKASPWCSMTRYREQGLGLHLCGSGWVQQGLLAQSQVHSHQQRREGRKSTPSGGWWRSDNQPMCWFRGRDEGVRHSERWNFNNFLRQSVSRKVGYIALSNWDKQMARRECEAHEGKEAIAEPRSQPRFPDSQSGALSQRPCCFAYLIKILPFLPVQPMPRNLSIFCALNWTIWKQPQSLTWVSEKGFIFLQEEAVIRQLC